MSKNDWDAVYLFIGMFIALCIATAITIWLFVELHDLVLWDF